MTDLDWDLIFRVHVKGAYSVKKTAWPYMRKQNYGRIIVTSSIADIYGDFGQTNYAAAKSALVGFSNSLAQEGAKYNILAKTAIPAAGSRLTQTTLLEAFMGGKLEVKRNVMLRQELQTILEKKRKSKLQLLTLQIR
ncbi:hypothetical protein NECAME_03406 [Necator americanus]|uniref:3-oxoacyl-[acyl-carrier-protein] reductase domain protein n=1 Tax=Necator americanus TaxID=51031 RepID=W2T5K4_NECAM|nr:hypothetical protein NECAME_03406 [Necator americanus]ETN76476.1 hypothetical protein NECAME_03406 [Necator americanus]